MLVFGPETLLNNLACLVNISDDNNLTTSLMITRGQLQCNVKCYKVSQSLSAAVHKNMADTSPVMSVVTLHWVTVLVVVVMVL